VFPGWERAGRSGGEERGEAKHHGPASQDRAMDALPGASSSWRRRLRWHGRPAHGRREAPLDHGRDAPATPTDNNSEMRPPALAATSSR
jgi:hypothetical protein